MAPVTGTSAGLDAQGWKAGCQQPGTLHGVSKTKCQPLEWDWGPIYLCCSTGASVGVRGSMWLLVKIKLDQLVSG